VWESFYCRILCMQRIGAGASRLLTHSLYLFLLLFLCSVFILFYAYLTVLYSYLLMFSFNCHPQFTFLLTRFISLSP